MARFGAWNIGRASCEGVLLAFILTSGTANPACGVSGDLAAFRTQYPAAVGSRIDKCSLCHGAVPQLNPYGNAFSDAAKEFPPIEPFDSDGDGASNVIEIGALTFPGNPNDTPPTLASPTPTGTPTPSPPSATPTATATTPVQVCTCDCSADNVVTVDELLIAINIALGLANVDVCLPADRDGDGTVTIDEILAGVNAALNGCG